MKKTAATALMFLAGIATVLGFAAPASAATKHSILTSVSAEQVEGTGCGNDAKIKTTVKLHKGHIASFLTVDLYVGKTWKGTRDGDVNIGGKTKVTFISCVPFKFMFSAKTGAYYNTKIRVITMPRSRDSRTVTIRQFGPDY